MDLPFLIHYKVHLNLLSQKVIVHQFSLNFIVTNKELIIPMNTVKANNLTLVIRFGV